MKIMKTKKVGRFTVQVSAKRISEKQEILWEDEVGMWLAARPDSSIAAVCQAADLAGIDGNVYYEVISTEPYPCSVEPVLWPCNTALHTMMDLSSGAAMGGRMIHCPECGQWWQGNYGRAGFDWRLI